MTKYSTGSSGQSDEGESCELCGKDSDELVTVSVAGADLAVCPACRRHDENFVDRDGSKETSNRDGGQGQSEFDSQRSNSGTSPLWDSDTSRWERDGANYDSDQLPYLVDEYGTIVQEERVSLGLTLDELADELDVSQKDLFAVEQGNAATMGVGGRVILELEEYLDVQLVAESE